MRCLYYCIFGVSGLFIYYLNSTFAAWSQNILGECHIKVYYFLEYQYLNYALSLRQVVLQAIFRIIVLQLM